MSSTKQRRGLLERCKPCGDKLTFRTRGDANRFLASGHITTGRRQLLVAYPCPHGPGFHVGHSWTREAFVDPKHEAQP